MCVCVQSVKQLFQAYSIKGLGVRTCDHVKKSKKKNRKKINNNLICF